MLLGAPVGEPEARHDLVEDEERPQPTRQLPEALQEPGPRANGPLKRLHDDGGQVGPVLRRDPLRGVEVVEGGHEDALQRTPGHAAHVRAGIGVRGLRRHAPVADHGVVVEAVPAPLELEELLPACEGASHAAGEHGRLGSRRDEADLLGTGHRLHDGLGEADRGLGEPEEGGAPRDLLLDRPHDRRMGVSQKQGTGPEDVVEIGAAAEVDEPGPLAVVDDERELGRQRVLTEARARQDRTGGGEQLAGPGLHRFELDRHRGAPSVR